MISSALFFLENLEVYLTHNCILVKYLLGILGEKCCHFNDCKEVGARFQCANISTSPPSALKLVVKLGADHFFLVFTLFHFFANQLVSEDRACRGRGWLCCLGGIRWGRGRLILL